MFWSISSPLSLAKNSKTNLDCDTFLSKFKSSLIYLFNSGFLSCAKGRSFLLNIFLPINYLCRYLKQNELIKGHCLRVQNDTESPYTHSISPGKNGITLSYPVCPASTGNVSKIEHCRSKKSLYSFAISYDVLSQHCTVITNTGLVLRLRITSRISLIIADVICFPTSLQFSFISQNIAGKFHCFDYKSLILNITIPPSPRKISCWHKRRAFPEMKFRQAIII